MKSNVESMKFATELCMNEMNLLFLLMMCVHLKLKLSTQKYDDVTQCENMGIFLPLKFYVKSILAILKNQKLLF